MADDKDTKEVPVQTPMEALIVQGMLEKVSQEARDKLIGDALVHLMRERKDRAGWSHKDQASPLAEIFRTQLYQMAQEIVAKQIKEDSAIRTKVEAMLKKATEAVLESDDFAQLVSKLVEKALSKVSYDE